MWVYSTNTPVDPRRAYYAWAGVLTRQSCRTASTALLLETNTLFGVKDSLRTRRGLLRLQLGSHEFLEWSIVWASTCLVAANRYQVKKYATHLTLLESVKTGRCLDPSHSMPVVSKVTVPREQM